MVEFRQEGALVGRLDLESSVLAFDVGDVVGHELDEGEKSVSVRPASHGNQGGMGAR